MTINIEKLIWIVLEHFNNTDRFQRIRLECLKEQTGHYGKFSIVRKYINVDHLEGTKLSRFIDASVKSEAGERVIADFCEALGFDLQRLFYIARKVRQWESDRSWVRCFPFEKNTVAILNFIKKSV